MMFNDSSLIKEKYNIKRQLGEGSYGRVYLASNLEDKVSIRYNYVSL